MRKMLMVMSVIVPFIMVNCATTGSGNGTFTVQEIGSVNGKAVQFYTISNSKGMEVTFSNFGATICSVKVPDRNGTIEEVVFGYDTLDGYKNDGMFFGMIVGRYANRIANSQFILNGTTYKLVPNDGENQLHGGPEGFKTKVFDAKITGKTLVLTYKSPDGEMGYPGTLTAEVKYTLTENNEIDIQISAKTDKDTVVNLTNHSYWTLNGNGKGTVLNQQLTINADKFTPTNAQLIPTGDFTNVEGTPFDFKTPHAIGERINANYEAIKFGGGYDHNFMLNGSGFRKVADLYNPANGRRLEIFTDQPAMQMYTFNGQTIPGGHGGVTYLPNSGVAFETQFPPDGPNQPNFPSTVLKPGQTYKAHTIFKLSAD